jgi:hypothetical protein
VNYVKSCQVPDTEQPFHRDGKYSFRYHIYSHRFRNFVISAFEPTFNWVRLWIVNWSYYFRVFRNLNFVNGARSHSNDDSIIANRNRLDIILWHLDHFLRLGDISTHIKDFESLYRFNIRSLFVL